VRWEGESRVVGLGEGVRTVILNTVYPRRAVDVFVGILDLEEGRGVEVSAFKTTCDGQIVVARDNLIADVEFSAQRVRQFMGKSRYSRCK
jgi:hypothetical protein